MASSNDDLLATIAAEREIYRTFYKFFRLVDTNQYEQLVECFTKDALIAYDVMPGPTQRFHGRDEFTAFMSAGRPGKRERTVAHVLGQTLIEWTDGRPHLQAYATVWHWSATRTVAGRHRPADWTVVGLVEDDFEQEDGRWLISRRYVAPVAGLVAAGNAPM
ncbi:nuclear transport factor 2 family protein [Streptomyces himalayensis]|uniref:Nuclear transport factor 2 family protein n=1 Tax=Streptomyces himalayensis subsp. himalayensis TaxID=2756131 RepID=A0A7W0I7R6_9ACTN|nr:nuclear transport factor 2 family protein [Streptomyces himalayensis]MBA2945605.1 nuclear transport factor 2 family protein [Streptomyces himalayensis subsp. himalayensis]